MPPSSECTKQGSTLRIVNSKYVSCHPSCVHNKSQLKINMAALSIMPLTSGELFCCIQVSKQNVGYYQQSSSAYYTSAEWIKTDTNKALRRGKWFASAPTWMAILTNSYPAQHFHSLQACSEIMFVHDVDGHNPDNTVEGQKCTSKLHWQAVTYPPQLYLYSIFFTLTNALGNEANENIICRLLWDKVLLSLTYSLLEYSLPADSGGHLRVSYLSSEIPVGDVPLWETSFHPLSLKSPSPWALSCFLSSSKGIAALGCNPTLTELWCSARCGTPSTNRGGSAFLSWLWVGLGSKYSE